jgi:hypothetical protein
MSSFEFRGLEFHNSRMWRWASVEKALDFMTDTGLNALIFHQNDIIDHLVLPHAYFEDELMWRRWPIRKSTNYANQIYINKVIREARNRGIDFYLEVKEIWYPEAIVELFPDLRMPEGHICPTHPFWFQFLETKMIELLDALPDLAGVIVSPATRESKVSISTNPCSCERCRNTSAEQWYKSYLDAVFTPLSNKQKTLVVRDFAYTADQQNSVLDAAASCSKDIVIGLKNVPHDFWPTFPNNPRIGHTNGLRQWIEFDVWGQYCGLGVFPCSLVEDMQQRIQYCVERGATGAWFRTDWEICNEASTFNSFNILNLFGGALLTQNPDLDTDLIYQAWAKYGLFHSLLTESSTSAPVVPASPDAWLHLKEFMKASWKVIEKSLYVRGSVFQLSSKVQYSLDAIFHTMTKHHNRGNWDPESPNLLVTSDTNLAAIFAEKNEALEEVKQLSSVLKAETLGLPDSFVDEINEMLDLFDYYVQAFYHVSRMVFLSKRAIDTPNSANVGPLREALKEFSSYRERLSRKLAGTSYPFYVYWMLDETQLGSLEKDIQKRISEIEDSI